jgi:hypothetical protein
MIGEKTHPGVGEPPMHFQPAYPAWPAWCGLCAGVEHRRVGGSVTFRTMNQLGGKGKKQHASTERGGCAIRLILTHWAVWMSVPREKSAALLP